MRVLAFCLLPSAFCLLASGCGSLSRLGGKAAGGSGIPSTSGAPVASFVATADPATGRIAFRPEHSVVTAQATAYGHADDISLSGTGTYDPATARLAAKV